MSLTSLSASLRFVKPRDLIARVAGNRDYFCDLSKELLEEIIARIEHQTL